MTGIRTQKEMIIIFFQIQNIIMLRNEREKWDNLDVSTGHQ